MQTTSPVWKGLLASGAALQARATIGGTVYTDISAPVIDRATMSGSLAVGNVVSASLALAVRGALNLPRSVAVIVEVRLNDGETASEWLPQGTFYISRRARDPVTGLLALECYDALLKANAVWVPSAGAWPRTMAAVTAELAALLGVELDSRTVIPTGAAYAMSEPAEGTTIRDALSLVGQAAGGNWIMTPAGKLRLVRLGEAGDTVDVAGVVGGIDVGRAGTITGVRSTVDGVATLTGDDTGIVVDVAVAPMIAVELAEALIGQAWQPFRLDGAVYDPAAELGDAVNAGANGEVAATLCSEQAAYSPAFRGSIAAPDPGEVTDESPYLGSAERTLALAKAAANRAVKRYDDNLTQQEIFNRLTDNGAAQGLVLFDGQLYVNASYIRSGTLVLGGLNNVDGRMEVRNSNDEIIGTMDNNGFYSYSSPSIDRRTDMRANFSNGGIRFSGDPSEQGLFDYDFGGLYYVFYRPIGSAQILAYLNLFFPILRHTDAGNVYKARIRFGYENDVYLELGNNRIYMHKGIEIDDATESSDPSTGALVVDGGAGIGGDVNVAGALSVGDPGGTRENLGITPANIGAKPTQTAVVDPTASGTAVAFIDSITQNANGVITPTKKTVRSASQSESGLMSATDKAKLDGIAAGAQVNSLTGVKGNAESSYRTGNVNLTPANIGAKPTQTAVVDPTASGTAVAFIASITQNANGVITPTKKTVRSASQSESGLMSATDKAKLDGIAAGAQVNSLTGVKGNAESSYRTGNVNLTPANIGAAAADMHRYNFYTSPSQLGLSGDKTVLEIFNALQDNSVIVTSSNLKAADMPVSSTMGELMIWRLSAARSHILFYGKTPSVGTWRMYLGASSYNDDNANAPDGVWYRVYDSAAVVPVSAGGTGAKNAAGARANLEITPANIGVSISLTSTDTTAALLYNKLKDLETNYPASIRVVNDPMQSLTGKSISGGYGTVVKTGVESGTLVLSFDICYVAGNYRHAFTTRVSQTTITPGAVYRYTGTAVS